MKVVSVMTSEARGGAEYAAVDMLEALSARGHQTVFLTNQTGLVAGQSFHAREIEIGILASPPVEPQLFARWPLLARSLRRELEREWPYDVLLVHYKKEQLLSALLPRRLRPSLAWAEWGPVPEEMTSGPGRLA